MFLCKRIDQPVCLSAVAAALFFAAPALSATINVPADFATIQDAIDNAMDGDTILVADGTYKEYLNIDVPNLSVLSVNGAGAVSVWGANILADGVHFGGPGQGLTVRTTGSSIGVFVEGDVVGPDSVVIEDNIILGGEDSYGIVVNPTIQGGHLVIRNNTIANGGGDSLYSFRTGIKFRSEFFDELDFSASAYKANIEIIGNTIDDVRDYGIRFKDGVYFSDVIIQSGSIDGAPVIPLAARCPSCEYAIGVEFGFLVTYTVVLVDNVSFDTVSYGVYLDGGVYDQSSLSITDCTIEHCYTGIYAYDAAVDLSALLIDGNTIRADLEEVDGWDTYGIAFYNGPTHNSTADINDNSLTDHSYAGVYTENWVAGHLSEFSITGNTVTGELEEGARYGLYLHYTVYGGANLLVSGNTITEFYAAGVTLLETYGGARTRILSNTITGRPDGAFLGIEAGQYYDGGTGEISDNVITGIGFNEALAARSECPIGIYVDFVGDGADHVICRNVITGTGFACTGIYFNETPTEGADQVICENTISAFMYQGIYFDGCRESGFGSLLNIMKNEISDAENSVHFDQDLFSALTVDILGNVFRFTHNGVRMPEAVTGCKVTIEQNRFIATEIPNGDRGGPPVGVNIGELNGGTEFLVLRNCFSNVERGVSVYSIEDVSFLECHRNDFAGAVFGIFAVAVDKAHFVDGENNWWGDPAGPNAGGSQATGGVDTDPFLTAPPDEDGDGVIDCDDECPDTPAGTEVDDWGCGEPPPPEQEQPMDDFMTDFSTNSGQGLPGCGQCGPIGASLYSLTLLGYVAALFGRRRKC